MNFSLIKLLLDYQTISSPTYKFIAKKLQVNKI